MIVSDDTTIVINYQFFFYLVDATFSGGRSLVLEKKILK